MKMKHSIGNSMTAVFSVVLLAALVICWMANDFFLERYYVANKRSVLSLVCETLDNASLQNKLEDETLIGDLSHMCEQNNITLFVMEGDGRVKMYNMRDYELIRNRLYMYLFAQFPPPDAGEVLEENERYTIRVNKDINRDMEYLEMYGVLADGEAFLLRTALEPIRESVILANRFLMQVGIAVLLMGVLIIRLLSKRITEPVLELAKLSERMSNLDFDVKFVGERDDEIGFLGSHMNQLSEALERTVSELKTVNNELQRDIEQKEKNDEMRKEFLSNVSHELKTPIALIQGYAEGLKECIHDDPGSRDFYCDVIIDEASKMNTMVKNLLTLNELEFGTEAVMMERFDVVSMIHNVLSASGILFLQQNVRVVFEQTVPTYVWANEFKVEEVLNNYISNALHHTDGERIIKVTVQNLTNSVKVSVFNTGKQIPEQEIGRIWDKFYKVDKARTREYGGSGVGLSIVKAIMESMHRNYGVVNYTNGVEFWFDLEKCVKS